MTDDLDFLLKQRYLAELSDALAAFGRALGLNETDRLANMDAVARLFVRFDSFPARSTWQKDLLRQQLADLGPSEGAEPARASPGAARLRAVQILHGERMTKPEWNRGIAWAKAHGNRRLKGDDDRWNLSEDEMAEAIG